MLIKKNWAICKTCKCFWRPHDNKTILNCEGKGIDFIPRVENLGEIYASNNNIGKINKEDLPDSLTFLDLQFNQLNNLNKDTLSILFSSHNRSVQLAGNSWLCNCDLKQLIGSLQYHRERILDYDSLNCVDGTSINTVDISSLCFTQTLVIAIISLFSILMLISVGSYVIWTKFDREIKALLYKRGLLCCAKVDNETKKEYDIFISFAQQDEQFVMEELLPKLEAEELVVCVHYRDWCAGDWIPAQIAKSVSDSSMTLVVLSRNFLRSPWALLEFRTAHVQTLQDGISRLAVLLLEDVFVDPEIDPELKMYLATTTYVRWNEPLFWEKLLYALPKPNAIKSQNDRSSGEGVVKLVRPDDPWVRTLQNLPPTTEIVK